MTRAIRARYLFERCEVRGVDAPLASATKDGVMLRGDAENAVWNPGDDVSLYKLVEPDDFVIGLRSFQHGIARSSVRGLVSPAYTVLRAKTEEVHPGYFAHYFRCAPLIASLDNLSQGIRQGRTIPYEPFSDLRLPLPPLAEQQRIAHFLDDQVAWFDRAVAQRYSQLQMLSERSLAAVSELLAPPARSTAGNSNTPWLSRDVGPLTKLSSVCLLQSGITVDASKTTGVEYPYLRVANVQNGSIKLDEVKRIVVPVEVARRSLLRPGDVLMTEGGDIDKLGRGSVWHGDIDPCLHQNHVFALRPDTAVLLPEYLAAMTRTHHARCYFESTGSQSTNLASTNSSKVLAFRLPLPPPAIQEAKLREVRANDEHADRLRAALQTQITLLQERKRALVTAAVTGQFDVTTARAVA